MDTYEEKHKKQGRAKETLFRVTYQHQGQLIQVADYKANLIISISTMIISAIIALIGFGLASGRGMEYQSLFILPVIVIILACLVALIFAIQAARPKILFFKPTTNTDKRSSLLFFRTIASHNQGEYIAKMKELLKNEEDIFEQMTIDLYNQGVVLKRKYDLLKYAYTVIMLGFIGSVAAFLIMLVTEQF